MAECAQTWTGSEQTSIPRIWQTTDVAGDEAFDYYREGICAAFMPLCPELGGSSRRGFQADVRSHKVGDATLNLVSATSHQVNRGAAEIAASPVDCYYLNLQLGGQCRISQNGRTEVLHSGEVGIFDSSVDFQLHHKNYPRLKVASLMLPRQLFSQTSGGGLISQPQVLSRDPLYGRLIAETMKSLVENISWAATADVCNLQTMILSLMGMSTQDDDRETSQGNRVVAQLARVKRIIRARCTKAGYRVADCAAEAGYSPRYIHQMFELDEDSFRTFLIRERLNLAAAMLRNPSFAHVPISTISFDAGFLDPSHFTRTFRAQYSLTPGEWRNSQQL